MRYKHLLDGLEVSILSLKEILENIDFRIDAEFHKKGLAKNLLHQYVSIGSILKRIQYGLSIEMNEDAIGTKIYRMNEIHNMICDSDVAKWADISSSEKQVFKLYDGDVLFNRTNSFEWVGRTGLFKQRNDNEFVFASYLIRLNPDIDCILPEYLTTFLNSKFGVWDIKRRARMSINQSNVNAEEVKAIQIPLLSKTFQQQLKICFDKAIELQNSAEINYQTAEHLLLDALGLRNWQPTQANTAIISLSNSFLSSGRLDAEYYQPKYEQLETHLKQFPTIRLNDLVNMPITSGSTPKAGGDDYTDETTGVAFVRAVDLINGVVSMDNLVYIKQEVHNNMLKKTKLKKEDVLFSIAGTVGRCAIFQQDAEANINQALAILRFDETKVLRTYLILFFNSYVGKMLVEKYARQGVQTNLNLPEVSNLPMPILPMPIQQQIATLIQAAQSAQHASKRLLSVAQEAVERAITSGEASALSWIAQNS